MEMIPKTTKNTYLEVTILGRTVKAEALFEEPRIPADYLARILEIFPFQIVAYGSQP